jgi:hypothetical protein
MTTTTYLTGAEIRNLMRAGGHTIRSLAAAMNITQTRVRHVRAHGVRGDAFVMDWLEATAY